MEDKETYIKVTRHNANKPVVVYSGSMIQQNHGEKTIWTWLCIMGFENRKHISNMMFKMIMVIIQLKFVMESVLVIYLNYQTKQDCVLRCIIQPQPRQKKLLQKYASKPA